MKTKNQLILHSLFLGVCAGFLSSIESDFVAILFAFFSTSLTYYFLRKNTSSFLALSLFEWGMLVSSAVTFLFMKSPSQVTAALGLSALILYASNTRFSLRRILVLKPIAISTCWVVIGCFIPIIQTHEEHSTRYLIEQAMSLFFLTMLLSLLYDWRDHMNGLNDTKTLISFINPSVFKFMYALSIPFFFLMMRFSEVSQIHLMSFFIAAGLSACLPFFSKKLSYWQLTWLIDSSFIVYYLSFQTMAFLN